jgi:GH24 family phage-related lysozyme (muramidase)
MYNDLTESANCIRRIFSEWESKGIKVVITQDMFDVLVSLAFNTGCSSVRQSKFIQSLKKKNYKKAAEEIKTYNLETGFGGLNSRRQKESEKFLTGISV